MIAARTCRWTLALVVLTTLLVFSGGRAAQASVRGLQSLPPRTGGCPADIVRNSALGVTLTLPAGWQDYGYTLFAPGGLFVANPAIQNGKGYPLGLGIIPAGITAERDDARAVVAAVQRRLRDIPFKVTRTPLTIGGAPAVLLAPMPGAGPTVEVVLAHRGSLYTILAFKNRDTDPLRPEQIQALASLRFIPRVGPFPRATVPPANGPLPTPPSLVLAGMGPSRGVLNVQVGGSGYQPGEAVDLRACWTGTPRPGLHPSYTWYWWTGVAQASSRGVLDTVVTIPVASATYTTFRLRVVASDAGVGQHLASAVVSAPAPADRQPGGAMGRLPQAAPLLPVVLHGQLSVVSSSGGPLHRLRTVGLIIGPPHVSPDGRLIAYLATARRFLDRYGNATATDVWVVPVPGQAANAQAHQITPTESHVLRDQIRWSPDSQHIAYDEDRHVVVTDVATGARHAVLQVAPGPALTSLVAWSPDGRQIALAQPVPIHGPAYPTALRLLTVAAVGGPVRTSTVRFPPGALGHPVPPGSYPGESVDWLPDGRGFVVQTLAKGEGPPTPTGLWTVSAGGGVARLMVGTLAGARREAYPAGSPLDHPTRAIFSPDRSRLATDPLNLLWIADAWGQHGHFISVALGRSCTLTEVAWLANSAGLAYVTLCPLPYSAEKGQPAPLPRVRAALFAVGVALGDQPRLLYTAEGTDQPLLLIAPVTRCVLCGY